jgi:hypothetical protein
LLNDFTGRGFEQFQNCCRQEAFYAGDKKPRYVSDFNTALKGRSSTDLGKQQLWKLL